MKTKAVVVGRGAAVVVAGAVCPRCGAALILSTPQPGTREPRRLRCEVKACAGVSARGIAKVIGGAPCAS